MKALLLAAGQGTRLRPLTDALPKCLVPILGTPLLEIWLSVLPTLGVREVLVNTSYMAEDVHRFLSWGDWSARVEVAHEDRLLGTAGTLFTNKEFIKGEDLLVIHSDNLSLFDSVAFLRAFTERPKDCIATMMTFDTDTPHTCGIVRTGPSGVVLEMHEKVANPPGRRANGAVYIFSAAFIEELLSGQPCSDLSTEVLPQLMGRMNEFHNQRYHRDIGSIELYRTACTEALVGKSTLPRTRTSSWGRFADHAAFKRWSSAWKTSGLAVLNCRSPDEVPRLMELKPDVILMEQLPLASLHTLAPLAAGYPRTTIIPWKTVTHA